MWWMPGWKGNSKAENAAQKIRHHNVKALSVWTSEWEIFSPKSLQEWDIFTCGNDGKAGTREDVGIVALAWLVRLQPINQWWIKVQNRNNCMSATNQSMINQSAKPKHVLPFQTHGSPGRGSLTQTMPDHQCGCTPAQFNSSSNFNKKDTFILKCQQKDTFILWMWWSWSRDLLRCTFGHAGRVWKSKDDRHLVEPGKHHNITTLSLSLLFYNGHKLKQMPSTSRLTSLIRVHS